MNSRNPLQLVSGGIFVLFLAIAFLVSQENGELFLPILFVGLAITSLIGSFSTLSSKGIYGALCASLWFFGLAFCFLFGFWPWILFVVAFSMLLGAFARPIMATLAGMSFMTMPNAQPLQSHEEPPLSPQDRSQQSYQEGYQPSSPVPERYQEGGKQSSTEYDQPQSQYPQQELPPQ